MKDPQIEKGFILIHRKIFEWEWYQDINTKTLFLHLLLKANHKDKRWRGLKIERGSLVTGLNTLKKELKLSIQKIRTSLEKLRKTGEVLIISTNKYSIITVCNYEAYNNKNLRVNKRITNKQQTNNKQVTTTKQCNNDNNDNKEYIRASSSLSELQILWNELCTKLNKVKSNSRERHKTEQVRLKERNFEEWREVFSILNNSEWCCGNNENHWKATYDWIMKNSKNSQKVLEGNYNKNKFGSGGKKRLPDWM